MSRAVQAWIGVAMLLVLFALLGWPLERELFDWQPALALAQPWRLWSAVAVHYSVAHLAANLAGAALVAALGWAGRITMPIVWAWVAAWPLTHLGLIVEPRLAHYAGLSGVLHAGVAVAALHLVLGGAPAQRRIGAACLAGLFIKVASESPWGPPVFHAGLGISVAPLAHASGVFAGLLCGALAHLIERRRLSRPTHSA